MKIYGSGYDVLVKETCFGVIINGEKEVVEALVRRFALWTRPAYSSRTGISTRRSEEMPRSQRRRARPGFYDRV